MMTYWSSIYIYYDDLDFFLSTYLPRLNKRINKLYNYNNYFFIRYFDKGPHIRLRHELFDATDKDRLYKFVLENIDDITQEIRNKYEQKVDRIYIQQVEYEPEIHRYGGNVGILIAEEQFKYSSEVVLNFFRGKHLTSEDILGLALKINCVMLYVFCEAKIEKVQLFLKKYIYLNSTHRLKMNIQFSEFNIDNGNDRYLHLYELQKIVLVNYVENLWSLLDSDRIIDKDLNEWKNNMLEIKFKLNSSIKDIIFPYEILLHNFDALWPIIYSYFHMTNNRLGLHFGREDYILYLMCKIFSDVCV